MPPIKTSDLIIEENLSKISVIGIGMRTHVNVLLLLVQVLLKENIIIQMCKTSEIRISVMLSEKKLEKAIRVLHATFL